MSILIGLCIVVIGFTTIVAGVIVGELLLTYMNNTNSTNPLFATILPLLIKNK